MANKKMIKKVYVAVQNFVTEPQKEGWSRAQISIILLHEKKRAKFPLIKPQMKRKLAICCVLKVIAHLWSYFNIVNQKYQQFDHI